MKRLNKGSALLITLLIMVILTLSGISFLFMSDTENKISNNYYLAMRALRAAQSGVYLVNSWFNYSGNNSLTLMPTVAQIQFLPRIGTDNGANTEPTFYKWACQGPDNPNCTNFSLFGKPYVGRNHTSTVYHRFFGTEENPDIIIDYSNSNSAAFMDQVNALLIGSSTASIRITEIRLYSPPVSPNPIDPTDPSNIPYGICTVRITAEAGRRDKNGNWVETFSTRRVKAIITDMSYALTGVALDVDGFIDINGACQVHWGIMKTTKRIDDNNDNHISRGSPYYVNPRGVIYPCGSLYGNPLDTSGSGSDMPLQGQTLVDPWLLVRSKAGLRYGNQNCNNSLCVSDSACTGYPQAITLNGVTHWLLTSPQNLIDPGYQFSCDYLYNKSTKTQTLIKYAYMECRECTGDNTDPACGIDPSQCTAQRPAFNSNMFYNVFGCDPTIGFATAFRGYTYWKNVITTAVRQGGAADVYYLVPSGAKDEQGNLIGLCGSGKWGPPNDGTNCQDFDAWTSGKEGFWFFDTTDGKIPETTGSNLTDEVEAKGQYWSAGVQYICAKLYRSAGGATHDFPECKFPGEPLWENPDPSFKRLRNGLYDESITLEDNTTVWVDRFINLRYPSDYKDFAYVVDRNSNVPSDSWDKYGPEFTFRGYFKGIFYLTGKFRTTGNREFFGSVMLWNGDDSSSGTVEVWYNPELQDGIPAKLPSAVIEQIITDM